MLLNCINKISTTKTNEKEQKATMNHVYGKNKTKPKTKKTHTKSNRIV